ncbi:MAG: YraN family protein [Treponema sp.]|nr:MAG: YraN family protein [Treponema sp.]
MNKTIGNEGEEVVANYLRKKGFTVIERNYRTRTGEIDIIATQEDKIVFFEVKTMLHTQLQDLDLIIGKKKQIKINKTAKQFLQTHRQYSEMLVRIDVIVLTSNPFFTQEPELIHINNAFGDINA